MTRRRRRRRGARRSRRRRPTASSAAAWARPSRTSTGAWDSGFTELELLKRASLAGHRHRARAAPACPTSASWIAARTGDGAGAVHGPPGVAPDHARRGRRRRLRSTPSGGRRSTTSTSRSARGWTASAAGGGRGTTATPSPSTGPSARASRSATSARSASWSCPGPDVVEALERLYPCHVADIKPGRSRYALLLNERGHVMDDGMILRESETRFVADASRPAARPTPRCGSATGSTRGASASTSWTGRCPSPRSTSRGRSPGSCCSAPASPTRRASCGHVHADVAGVPVPRHAPVVHRRGRVRAAPPGRPLGRAVAGADGPGADLGIRPHGLQALFGLRLEKGHVIVGHGHRARHDAAAARDGLGGPDGEAARSSAGRRSSGRRSSPDQRRWSASRWTARRRSRAAPICVGRRDRRQRDRQLDSPLLGQALMLGWQTRTPFRGPRRDRRPRGRRRADPVLRPGGPPCPRLSRSAGCASWPSPAALDARALADRRRRHGPALRPGRGVRARRDAASRSTTRTRSSRTSAGFVGAWLVDGSTIVGAHVEWPLPTERPALAQGSIAGVPAKLLAARRRRRAPADRAPPTPHELASRLGWRRERVHRDACSPIRWRRAEAEPTTSSSSAAAATACRPPTTSRPATGSRTSPSSRPTTSRRATPAATRRSSGPTTASPRRSASTSTRLELYQAPRGRRPGAAILHQTKGILWLAHTEMAMRTERARCLMNTACGAKTVHASRRPSSRSSSRSST